jgi:hypothetical protein
MNLLLAYWKYRDTERDRERGIQKQLASRLNSAYDEICKAYPEQAAGVEKALEQIWAMEDGQEPDVDRLCALSGDMLGSVFAPKEDVFAPVLREIGKGLGKFVYLMDAYEDYEKDIKKGRFNPLDALQGPGYEELIRDSLTGMLSEACQAMDLLPLSQDIELLHNVVYEGVWNRYALLEEKKKGGKEKTES